MEKKMLMVSDDQKGKILIIGKEGQVSRALSKSLGNNCVSIGRDECDLANSSEIASILAQYEPNAIINAAAYTAVDKAEEEERLAFVVNGDAPGEMALYAFEHHIPFIHYSTDYVFAGTGQNHQNEDTTLSPVNAYGRSKLDGEMKIQAAASKYTDAKWFIFRTSWVYDETGHNFLNTMLRLGTEREQLNVVGDQIGAPTYAADLATYTVQALILGMQQSQFPSGIYHLCNKGETSWHNFAEEIFAILQGFPHSLDILVKQINKIQTSEYPTPAKRPLNSRLSTDRFEDTFNLPLPMWQDALRRCIMHKFEQDTSHPTAQHSTG